jgi:hypothetical protein
MNEFMSGKIEACIEISEASPEKFKELTLKTTNLTSDGFHKMEKLNKAYQMMEQGFDVDTICKTVLYS